MPKLFLFLLKNVAIGIFVGWAFVAALLWLDVGGFGTLVLESSSKYVALSLLAMGFAVTFGSASIATAVLLGDDFTKDDDDDKTRKTAPVFDDLAVTPRLVPAHAPKKHNRV